MRIARREISRLASQARRVRLTRPVKMDISRPAWSGSGKSIWDVPKSHMRAGVLASKRG